MTKTIYKKEKTNFLSILFMIVIIAIYGIVRYFLLKYEVQKIPTLIAVGVVACVMFIAWYRTYAEAKKVCDRRANFIQNGTKIYGTITEVKEINKVRSDPTFCLVATYNIFDGQNTYTQTIESEELLDRPSDVVGKPCTIYKLDNLHIIDEVQDMTYVTNNNLKYALFSLAGAIVGMGLILGMDIFKGYI